MPTSESIVAAKYAAFPETDNEIIFGRVIYEHNVINISVIAAQWHHISRKTLRDQATTQNSDNFWSSRVQNVVELRFSFHEVWIKITFPVTNRINWNQKISRLSLYNFSILCSLHSMTTFLKYTTNFRSLIPFTISFDIEDSVFMRTRQILFAEGRKSVMPIGGRKIPKLADVFCTLIIILPVAWHVRLSEGNKV